MANGWRNKRPHEVELNSETARVIYESNQSDDGWCCPHCGARGTRYLDLNLKDADDVLLVCSSCGEKYIGHIFTVMKLISKKLS